MGGLVTIDLTEALSDTRQRKRVRGRAGVNRRNEAIALEHFGEGRIRLCSIAVLTIGRLVPFSGDGERLLHCRVRPDLVVRGKQDPRHHRTPILSAS